MAGHFNYLLFLLASSLLEVVQSRQLEYRIPKPLTSRQLANIPPLAPAPPLNTPIRTTPNVSSALIMYLILAFTLGLYLIILSQRLWRFTIGLSFGLTLATLSWVVIFNTIPSRSPVFQFAAPVRGANGEDVVVLVTTPPFVSNTRASFYAETAAAITAIVAALVGLSLGFTRVTRGKGRQAGMVLWTLFGAMSFSVSLILVRPGFLIPLYAVNWVVIGLSVVGSLVLLWRIPQAEMLVAPFSVGLFLIATAIDTTMNGANGLLFGIRILFTFNMIVPNASYQPQLSSQVIIGISQAFVPFLLLLHYRFAPESWKVEWNWYCKDYSDPLYSGKDYLESPIISGPKSRFSL